MRRPLVLLDDRRTDASGGVMALDALAEQGGSMLDELLTAEQLAQRLQMKRSTVEDYARRRILPSITLGRHRRFVIRDVEQALAALRQPARPPRRARPR